MAPGAHGCKGGAMVKARNKSTSDVHEALEVLNDNRRRHGSDRATGAEITRVHEQLRREREMREKAERRADQAEENVRQMEATLGELRYSNRKLQEKLEARAEKSRESLASLRSGLEKAEEAARERADEGASRAQAALRCLARAQSDPDAMQSHLENLHRHLSQLASQLGGGATGLKQGDNARVDREEELERRASEAEGRAKAAEREVANLQEQLRISQESQHHVERLKTRLHSVERKAAEEARARESLERAASSNYSSQLRDALSLISSRRTEGAGTSASYDELPHVTSTHHQSRSPPGGISGRSTHWGETGGADAHLPGVQKLRREMDQLEAELDQQCRDTSAPGDDGDYRFRR